MEENRDKLELDMEIGNVYFWLGDDYFRSTISVPLKITLILPPPSSRHFALSVKIKSYDKGKRTEKKGIFMARKEEKKKDKTSGKHY